MPTAAARFQNWTPFDIGIRNQGSIAVGAGWYSVKRGASESFLPDVAGYTHWEISIPQIDGRFKWVRKDKKSNGEVYIEFINDQIHISGDGKHVPLDFGGATVLEYGWDLFSAQGKMLVGATALVARVAPTSSWVMMGKLQHKDPTPKGVWFGYRMIGEGKDGWSLATGVVGDLITSSYDLDGNHWAVIIQGHLYQIQTNGDADNAQWQLSKPETGEPKPECVGELKWETEKWRKWVEQFTWVKLSSLRVQKSHPEIKQLVLELDGYDYCKWTCNCQTFVKRIISFATGHKFSESTLRSELGLLDVD